MSRVKCVRRDLTAPLDVERYHFENGLTMARESGTLTPNGNDVAGRWVLRNGTGEWVDYDRYRNDLAERHDLELQGT